jgi:ElaB/YqjD/DUF883 family membrane-anchored ribosome-binding protein
MTKPTMHKEDIREDIKDDLEAVARKAGRRARKMIDETPYVSEGAESLAAAISEKPIQSMLIALGVGLLFGKIFSR